MPKEERFTLKHTKMLRTILLSFSLLFLYNFSFSKTIDIREAIKSGILRVVPEANGGHQERCIKLKLENLKKKKLEVFVPAGLIFHSVDSVVQDLIVIQERMLVLDKLQKRSFSLYAMCIQAGNASPSEGRLFETGPLADGNLLKVVEFVDKNNIRTSPAQYAIWAVTDNKRIENIRHPELAVFTAELLGKPAPKYFIHHANVNRPGERAFQDRPSIISGTFKYKSDRDRKVSFGLYDANGKLLHSAFEDQLQKKGGHKFKFRFEVRNVPKGKYFARLMWEGEILEQLEVEF